jgi:hypothetical protein
MQELGSISRDRVIIGQDNKHHGRAAIRHRE